VGTTARHSTQPAPMQTSEPLQLALAAAPDALEPQEEEEGAPPPPRWQGPGNANSQNQHEEEHGLDGVTPPAAHCPRWLSAWPESRWNLPCFSFLFVSFLFPKEGEREREREGFDL